ncbi:hypothetical protein [Parendozoicomonas haliclonae]|uniref:Uncharacterized protein n=1 Tax=Parendozoicomonas haliclonae TaxID=1960125 RepID=A0A1X7ARZ0_9GAMM|nr:hypothetical protein [Parendozoicomonas haliclonae]SMA50869.1 hypothetical protein EHSB41UT_04687 [Parendozoicomonas haliclonae]
MAHFFSGVTRWLMVVMITLFSSSVFAANQWLVAVLLGNARADAWLINMDDYKDVPPVHVMADTKTEAAFINLSGNIGSGGFEKGLANTEKLTDALLGKLLPQIKKQNESAQAEDIDGVEINFLYAMAGLDLIDGRVPGSVYQADEGRAVLSRYESHVDQQFRNHGLAINTLLGASDAALLLNAVRATGSATSNSDASNLVIYDDTYGIGYRLNDHGIEQKAELVKPYPQGGFYALGYQGGALLADDPELARPFNDSIRSFWDQQGVHYSPLEVSNRYAQGHKNELGGVMSRLFGHDDNNLSPEVFHALVQSVEQTARSLGSLALEVLPDNKPESASAAIPVKIIGFYGDTLAAFPALSEIFDQVTGGLVVPELVHGAELEEALATAAVETYQQLLKARYGL